MNIFKKVRDIAMDEQNVTKVLSKICPCIGINDIKEIRNGDFGMGTKNIWLISFQSTGKQWREILTELVNAGTVYVNMNGYYVFENFKE